MTTTPTSRGPLLPSRPPRLLSDAGLARAAGADDAAFAEVVRRHGARLRRHCERVAGPQLADDAFQHALADAHRALRAGTEPRELRPWLMGVGHYAALGVLRRTPPAWQELGDDLDGVPQPPAVVAQREDLRAMLDAVGRLPERQRRALVLRECEGRSWQEVADALGTGEGAVRQLLFRAREQLRAGVAVVAAPVWLLRAERARAALTAGWGKVAAGSAAGVVAVGGGAVVLEHRGAAQHPVPHVAPAAAEAASRPATGTPTVASGSTVAVAARTTRTVTARRASKHGHVVARHPRRRVVPVAQPKAAEPGDRQRTETEHHGTPEREHGDSQQVADAPEHETTTVAEMHDDTSGEPTTSTDTHEDSTSTDTVERTTTSDLASSDGEDVPTTTTSEP